ncbi:hypothetical protein [Legionella sp. CNM-4043-24]|uniref:hypothetical protein n=1 Tax=Legionella sp. CNM-4043-24 TaxID=3421646 RepID=UPI00403A906E
MFQDTDENVAVTLTEEEQALVKARRECIAKQREWREITSSERGLRSDETFELGSVEGFKTKSVEFFHMKIQRIQSDLDSFPALREEYAATRQKLLDLQDDLRSSTDLKGGKRLRLTYEITWALDALEKNASSQGYRLANRECHKKLEQLQEIYSEYLKEKEEYRLFKTAVDNVVEHLENLKKSMPTASRSAQLIDARILELKKREYYASPDRKFNSEAFQAEYYRATLIKIDELERLDSAIAQLRNALDNPLCPAAAKDSVVDTLNKIEATSISSDMFFSHMMMVTSLHETLNTQIKLQEQLQQSRRNTQLMSDTLTAQQPRRMQATTVPAAPQHNAPIRAAESRPMPAVLPVQSREELEKNHYRRLLGNYINRVAGHKKTGQPGTIDFAHGFMFFSKSRAINREINFRLAQRLLSRLDHQTVAQVFAGNLDAVRQEIIHENHIHERSHYSQSDITHSELNTIVQRARR